MENSQKIIKEVVDKAKVEAVVETKEEDEEINFRDPQAPRVAITAVKQIMWRKIVGTEINQSAFTVRKLGMLKETADSKTITKHNSPKKNNEGAVYSMLITWHTK